MPKYEIFRSGQRHVVRAFTANDDDEALQDLEKYREMNDKERIIQLAEVIQDPRYRLVQTLDLR